MYRRQLISGPRALPTADVTWQSGDARRMIAAKRPTVICARHDLAYIPTHGVCTLSINPPAGAADAVRVRRTTQHLVPDRNRGGSRAGIARHEPCGREILPPDGRAGGPKLRAPEGQPRHRAEHRPQGLHPARDAAVPDAARFRRQGARHRHAAAGRPRRQGLPSDRGRARQRRPLSAVRRSHQDPRPPLRPHPRPRQVLPLQRGGDTHVARPRQPIPSCHSQQRSISLCSIRPTAFRALHVALTRPS